jgi:sucrose-6-phosphate hydrolase SacC (GH32 family)
MLRVDLPSVAFSFEVRVLAGHASSSNATSIMINVSAANPDYAAGPRRGLISTTPSFAPKRANAQGFDVLPEEHTLDLRVLTDRSIVEAFAMGGRGTMTTHDYPSEGSAMFHLVNWGKSPLIVRNLSIASMACGWA